MKIEELREIESVEVHRAEVKAGTLERTQHGAVFTYDEEFRAAQLTEKGIGVAFSMPPTERSHRVSGVNLHPFFAGLLPEGLRLQAIKRMIKTSEDDLFSLLLTLGASCIGDVYLRPSDDVQDSAVEELSSISFQEEFEKSISTPLLKVQQRDSGIPGMMPKISASMISFPPQIRKKSRQYILKLEPDGHPRIIENEHFFMQLAGACGLPVARSQIVRDKDNKPGLLVERFDRVYNRRLKRFESQHQEDACQFLALYPQEKYRLPLRRIAEGLVACCDSPIVEVRKLLDLYLFSYLIGNGDLHAKNISVLQERESGRVQLAPAYDLLSTLPYGDRRMALKIGSRDDGIRIADLVEFGATFEVPAKAIRASADEIVAAVREGISHIDEIGLDRRKSNDLRVTIANRIRTLN